MRPDLSRFLLLAGLSLALLASAAMGADKKKPKPPPTADAPPTLVSTDAGGPKWKNLQQLEQFAAQGDPQACFELGDRLLTGDGFPADAARARPLFEKAAEGGIADAWFRLGKIYHEGLGVDQDYAKAFDYYVQAAKRGVPEAQHNVGAMLVSGRGVKRDYVEGLAWLIVATKDGAVSTAEAQTREHLAKRPADIAAAEKRAAELLQSIKDHTAVDPKADVKAGIEAPKAEKNLPFQPERAEPPKIPVAPVDGEKLKPVVPVSPDGK